MQPSWLIDVDIGTRLGHSPQHVRYKRGRRCQAPPGANFAIPIFAIPILAVLPAAVGSKRLTIRRWGPGVAGWLSAHVYLGTALIVVATLHTGFEFGWSVHTLAYALTLAVVLSGFWLSAPQDLAGYLAGYLADAACAAGDCAAGRTTRSSSTPTSPSPACIARRRWPLFEACPALATTLDPVALATLPTS